MTDHTPEQARSGSPFVLELSIGGDGPRVAVKDTIDIEGCRTTAGSRAFAAAPPAARNARVVQRLLDAGCRIVGKTTLHELAYGVTGINDRFGTPVNPSFPDLIPGGSSSGSAAAVAGGLADFALGTDTGGSVRIPAACCGVVGLKPTFGRLSRDGVVPAASSLDCVGVFARTVTDVEAAMAMLDDDYRARDAEGITIGLVATEGNPIVSDAVRDAVAAAGFAPPTLSLPSMDAAFAAGLTVIGAENYAAYHDILETADIGADVLARLRKTAEITPDDVGAAEAVRRRFRDELDRAFAEVDLLVMPTLSDLPPTLAEAQADRTAVALTRNVRPFNLSGHPAIALPIGTHDGRPISLQIVGRMGEDETVCAVAGLIEASLRRRSR